MAFVEAVNADREVGEAPTLLTGRAVGILNRSGH